MDTEKKLKDALSNITEELKGIAHYTSETDDWEAVPDQAELKETDPNSEADAAEEWEERRATVTALETEYRNIKRALAKIEAGTYGICEISGEPIEADRLAAKPTARTCKAHMDEEATLPL